MAPLAWAAVHGAVPIPIPGKETGFRAKTEAPVGLLILSVALQAGLTFTVAAMMPSGLEASGFARVDAVNAVTLYLGAMFVGSIGCGFLAVGRSVYPIAGLVYLAGLGVWMEGLGGWTGLMGTALMTGRPCRAPS